MISPLFVSVVKVPWFNIPLAPLATAVIVPKLLSEVLVPVLTASSNWAVDTRSQVVPELLFNVQS